MNAASMWKSRSRAGGWALIAAACLLLPPLQADAQTQITPNPVCVRVRDVPFPAADQASPSAAASLRQCNSGALFFGFTGPIDRQAARTCAYLELAGKVANPAVGRSGIAPDPDRDFGRSWRLLALIYGNGLGVPQNYPLAEKFACHDEYALTRNSDQQDIHSTTAQVDAEIKQLTTGQAAGAKTPLGLCSSFYQEGKDDWCQPLEVEATRSLEAHRELDPIPPAQARLRAGLEQLLAAELRFRNGEQPEIDLSGTSAAYFSWQAVGNIDREFFSLLDALRGGSLPTATAAQLATDDAKLNEIYKTVQPQGTVKRENVQQVERLWLGYRDAWARFVAEDLPSRAPGDVVDVLTRHRAAMLACLAESRPYQDYKDGAPLCGE